MECYFHPSLRYLLLLVTGTMLISELQTAFNIQHANWFGVYVVLLWFCGEWTLKISFMLIHSVGTCLVFLKTLYLLSEVRNCWKAEQRGERLRYLCRLKIPCEFRV